MKVTIFSDLHIHDYKQYNNGGNRLTNCLDALEKMCKFSIDNGITTMLFGGDLFDTQKVLFVEVVNKTIERFIKIFSNYPELKIYAITGNHDQSSKSLIDSPAVSALDHLASIFPDNFIVVDNAVQEIAKGIVVVGIPYFEFKEHFQKRLQKLAETTAAIKAGMEEEGLEPKAYLLIHQTARGNGNAMIPYDTDPTDEVYKIFDHVYCGHIHNREELTAGFTNIGSPMHRDLGDAGMQKGFYVRNLAKPEKGHKFIYLSGFPEFVVRKEGEAQGETDEANFVVVEPDYDALAAASTANVEEFNTSLENKDLLTNFWKHADGKDKELLSIGLEFIQ
jgi:DNA repair exonuclease SbcCD nuclease subunit